MQHGMVYNVERANSCVNSLSGVPDAWLEDGAAAKALLAVKALSCGAIMSSNIPSNWIAYSPTLADYIILCLVKRRCRGSDFGELNALIDSFA